MNRFLISNKLLIATLFPLSCYAATGLSQAANTVNNVGSGDSVGYVIRYFMPAIYQTPGGEEECPYGFHHTMLDNFKAQFRSESEQKEVLKKYGYFTHRGPNGENAFYHPAVVRDLLPFREAQGSTAYGLNLDGVISDDDFVDPDGNRGIDNQLYRVVACIPGFRKDGMIQGQLNAELRGTNKPRLVIEILGVDNLINDDDVVVKLYRGLDPVEVRNGTVIIPFGSQRIDYRYGKRFMKSLRGKISGGVLTTEPADLVIPAYEQTQMPGENRIKAGRFVLTLSESEAKGYLGGYLDVEYWYLMFAKTWGGHYISESVGWSGPATYQALHNFADAYPDHKGKNTAISVAYDIEFSRTFVIHDSSQDDVKIPDSVGVE